jgi:hypothetical protein
MFPDRLGGMNLVVVGDRVERVVDFVLPRTRVKTASIRKAYNRLRRRAPVVYKHVVHRFEDVTGAECVMMGDTLYVSPRGLSKLPTADEDLSGSFFGDVLPRRHQATTADVSAEKILEAMKLVPAPRLNVFDARNLEMLTRPVPLSADLFRLASAGIKYRFVKEDYGIRAPAAGFLLCAV